ncbi:hypothetical protein M758_7G121700 [Ceratodon purpureus]|nr:hypothetical protein M758_7G121700 [Ceratodon purpureus]
MNTSKAIFASQSTFQNKLLVPSSSKSAGAASIISNARQKSSNGRVTMACFGAPRYDPYTTLAVARGTSKNEVMKAYRRLALRYHPNASKGNRHTTNFQLIKLAYETLMNMLAPEFIYETLLSMATPQFEEFEEASLDKPVEGPVAVGDDDQWKDWEEWMMLENSLERLDSK